jgi:hypothetical protein
MHGGGIAGSVEFQLGLLVLDLERAQDAMDSGRRVDEEIGAFVAEGSRTACGYPSRSDRQDRLRSPAASNRIQNLA